MAQLTEENLKRKHEEDTDGTAKKKCKKDGDSTTKESAETATGSVSKFVDINCLKEDDPYHLHLNKELQKSEMNSPQDIPLLNLGWEHIKKVWVPDNLAQNAPTLRSTDELTLIPLLRKSLRKALSWYRKPKTPGRTELSSLQKEILSIAGSYKDLGYQNRTHENGEDIRFAYALHALNHVLKSYITLNKNNILKPSTPIRDQGFCRTKVLIILPYRHSAYRVGKHIAALMEGHVKIQNMERFNKEYYQISTPGTRKSAAYYQNFEGNNDEDFKLGIRITSKALTFFSDFYSSDIIIASMLGLRTVVKTKGGKDRDFEFLSSIEMLIIDQYDALLMQNLEYLDVILQCLNQIPKKAILKSNLLRIRNWMLDDCGKSYRQTLLFSNIYDNIIEEILLRKCFNYEGQILSKDIQQGVLARVTQPVTKEFIKVDNTLMERFDFFQKNIFPQLMHKSHVLIYVRTSIEARLIAKLLKDNDLPLSGISEEEPDKSVVKFRILFYKGKQKITYFTERKHFYSDYLIKGVRHLVFFQLPKTPRLFAQACEFLSSEWSNKEAMDAEPEPSCTCLFSETDYYALRGIVGDSKCYQLLLDEDNTTFKL